MIDSRFKAHGVVTRIAGQDRQSERRQNFPIASPHCQGNMTHEAIRLHLGVGESCDAGELGTKKRSARVSSRSARFFFQTDNVNRNHLADAVFLGVENRLHERFILAPVGRHLKLNVHADDFCAPACNDLNEAGQIGARQRLLFAKIAEGLIIDLNKNNLWRFLLAAQPKEKVERFCLQSVEVTHIGSQRGQQTHRKGEKQGLAKTSLSSL